MGRKPRIIYVCESEVTLPTIYQLNRWKTNARRKETLKKEEAAKKKEAVKKKEVNFFLLKCASVICKSVLLEYV